MKVEGGIFKGLESETELSLRERLVDVAKLSRKRLVRKSRRVSDEIFLIISERFKDDFLVDNLAEREVSDNVGVFASGNDELDVDEGLFGVGVEPGLDSLWIVF